VKEIYLTLDDAAKRIGRDAGFLLHLAATKQLSLFIRALHLKAQPIYHSERYGSAHSVDGLLEVPHGDVAKLEAGNRFVLVQFFGMCRYITSPIEGPRSKSAPPPPDPKLLNHTLIEDPVTVSKNDLLVLFEDLEPLLTTISGGAGSQGGWPWGSYETELLRKLAEAGEEFWRRYDPTDSTTAPTNKMVEEWLIRKGVASRIAESMATILRADGLRPGPRK
jgi:hypothetical protein